MMQYNIHVLYFSCSCIYLILRPDTIFLVYYLCDVLFFKEAVFSFLSVRKLVAHAGEIIGKETNFELCIIV